MRSGAFATKATYSKFGRADRNDAAQLRAQFRLRQQTVVNSEWLVRKFVHPVHVLPLDKEIRRIEEAADTYRHVVIQEIGGLRDLQIGRGVSVLEFEFQLAFKEKPIGQLPEKNSIEGGVEERILTTSRREAGSAVTSEEKFRRSGKRFFHLRL